MRCYNYIRASAILSGLINFLVPMIAAIYLAVRISKEKCLTDPEGMTYFTCATDQWDSGLPLASRSLGHGSEKHAIITSHPLTAIAWLTPPDWDGLRVLAYHTIVLLLVESILSVVMLLSNFLEKEFWMRPWLIYHAIITLFVAIVIAVMEKSTSATLYCLLGTMISACLWIPVFFHRRQLISFHEIPHDLDIEVGVRFSTEKR